jgi:hypothetical protein
MKRIIMMLALAAFLVAALSVSALSAFGAQDLPPGCSKVQGKVVCTTENPPGNSGNAAGDPDPGGTTTTTTTTQGNTTNFSPEPQGTGTSCSGPPGRCR